MEPITTLLAGISALSGIVQAYKAAIDIDKEFSEKRFKEN